MLSGRRSLRLVLLGAAFVAVHLGLALVNVLATRYNPAGDVTGVYRFWVDYWHETGVLVGIATPWVYPIGALPPMLAASLLGDAAYLWTWLGIVTALDAVAVVLLARRHEVAAWWWLAFTALLGPVALSRVDAIALPVALVGVLAVAARPWLASLLLTAAAWIKVWPAAMVVAMLVALRRVSGVITAAALTSAAVILVAIALGARGTVFSFITTQADRGLQVEAPVALPWLWSAALGDPGVQVYYDTTILTWQLRGQGVATVAAVMTPVLLAGVLAVIGLALAARLRGAEPLPLLAVASLGLVSAVIGLNKVGSPQYLTWYVAPIVLGLLVDPRRFRAVAVVGLVAAGLTQVLYPWQYAGVIGPTPWVIAVLTLRNALEVGLLGWALVSLAGLRAPLRMRTGAVPVQRPVASR